MTERHGERPDRKADEPSPVITSMARSASWTARAESEPAPTIVTTRRSSEGLLIGRQLDDPEDAQNIGGWKFRNGTQQNACSRSLDEPAGTLFFGHQMNDVSWIYERQATTVCADPRISEPDYRGGRRAHELGLVGADPHQRSGSAEASVRVTVAEASVLQSFRPDYPWQGSRTKQFEQVGNAVPPLLARHVIAALLGLDLTGEVAA